MTHIELQNAIGDDYAIFHKDGKVHAVVKRSEIHAIYAPEGFPGQLRIELPKSTLHFKLNEKANFEQVVLETLVPPKEEAALADGRI